MKTVNMIAVKLKEMGRTLNIEGIKTFMVFGFIILMGTQAHAAGNPIFQILQSEMAASIVKWVCVPLGIITFVEALISAISGGGSGKFLGQVLSAIILVGIGIYFEQIIQAFAGFNQ